LLVSNAICAVIRATIYNTIVLYMYYRLCL